VKARERRSDVESELESEAPTEVDDMIFFEEEESREVAMTLAVRRDPAAMSAGDEQEAERHVVVPVLRKRAASADTVDEWEAKRTWSPRPSVASPVSSPPAAGVTEQARRSEERACTRQDRCQHVTRCGRMARPLLRSVRPEPMAMVTRKPGRSRLG